MVVHLLHMVVGRSRFTTALTKTYINIMLNAVCCTVSIIMQQIHHGFDEDLYKHHAVCCMLHNKHYHAVCAGFLLFYAVHRLLL